MSRSRPGNRKIVFVTPRPEGESLRAARAVGTLDDVVVLGVTEGLPDPGAADAFRDLDVVGDTHDSGQLVDAVRDLAGRWGGVERIVVVHETLLAPAARASEALGLPGMSESTVLRALDKSRLRRVLHRAGIDTACEQILADCAGRPALCRPCRIPAGAETPHWRRRPGDLAHRFARAARTGDGPPEAVSRSPDPGRGAPGRSGALHRYRDPGRRAAFPLALPLRADHPRRPGRSCASNGDA